VHMSFRKYDSTYNITGYSIIQDVLYHEPTSTPGGKILSHDLQYVDRGAMLRYRVQYVDRVAMLRYSTGEACNPISIRPASSITMDAPTITHKMMNRHVRCCRSIHKNNNEDRSTWSYYSSCYCWSR